MIAPIQSIALQYFDKWAASLLDEGILGIAPDLCAGVGLKMVTRPGLDEALLLGGLLHAQDFGTRMKSITGMSEWDLGRVSGDLLPDGTIPIWRPGFEVLRASAQAAKAKSPARAAPNAV